MRPEIFVSYSHRDSDLVAPIVALLRASKALVFRDADQLMPGKKWRQQLDSAISNSTTILVFWCDHSRSSEEVKKEYTAAIQQRKDLLPLLLDSTPLPEELAEYQYIDFRAAFPNGHAHRQPYINDSLRQQPYDNDSPFRKPPIKDSAPRPDRPESVRAPNKWRLLGFGALLVLFSISIIWNPLAPTPRDEVVRQTPIPHYSEDVLSPNPSADVLSPRDIEESLNGLPRQRSFKLEPPDDGEDIPNKSTVIPRKKPSSIPSSGGDLPKEPAADDLQEKPQAKQGKDLPKENPIDYANSLVVLLLAILGIFIVLCFLVVRAFRFRWKRDGGGDKKRMDTASATEQQIMLAATIENELLQRTGKLRKDSAY